MKNKMKFYAQRTPFRGHVELTVISEWPNGRLDIMQEPKFTEHPDYQVTRPAMTLTNTEAQQLMDSLWDAGLRPSEGSGSAGAMLAVQEHLKDMRRLVFDNQVKNDEK